MNQPDTDANVFTETRRTTEEASSTGARSARLRHLACPTAVELFASAEILGAVYLGLMPAEADPPAKAQTFRLCQAKKSLENHILFI